MNVERDIDNIDLTQEQISLLIREAFPNHFSIEGNLATLSGGAINSTYKFMIEKEDFVLRVYARDRACCKIEQEVHDLISTKISIPQLIYSNERHVPWAYAIFRFMPGIHIYDASDESKISLASGEKLQRLRRKVAFDRLLARLFSSKEPNFFLKGGYAMELRLKTARATKDIDLTTLKRAKGETDLLSIMQVLF